MEKWVKVVPDCGPHGGHSGRVSAALESDSPEPGKNLHLTHDEIHVQTVLPHWIKVGKKRYL